MNELQVRLTADISALQSALTKAKATIKSFESETAKESEKGNVGFKRKIGLIEQLTIKANSLRTALSKATNEAQIESYNKELQNTATELTRLNALGRSVSANLGATSGGFNKLGNSVGNANGVALEFNRIIQDAPFGLIGIGNNIQQLTANFAQLKSGGQSTGAVIKASLSALISPANLLVLGISAVTAGFTAYQMGAFDFVTATDEAKTAQDEFNESLKDTEQTLKEGFYNELLKSQGLLKQENLGGRLIDVPAFETANEVLQKLGSTIDGLNKNELEALSSFLEQRLADAARSSSNAATELERTLANTDVGVYEQLLTKVNEQLSFYESDTKKSTKATKELQQEINSFSTNPLVDAYFEAIKKGAEFRKGIDALGLTGLEGEDPFTAIENAIASSMEKMGAPVTEYADEAQKLKETNNVLLDSFSALGIGIASSFNISNDALKGFITTFISSTPKIIQAIVAQAAAKKAASKGVVASNIEEGTTGAVVLGIEAAKGLGPVGLALLPVLIGGALAIVSSAFGKSSKGGGGSGGVSAGASSGANPQLFTNQYTVQPPTPTSPNYSGSSIDFDNAQSRMTVDIDGDKLKFIVDRADERKKAGG